MQKLAIISVVALSLMYSLCPPPLRKGHQFPPPVFPSSHAGSRKASQPVSLAESLITGFGVGLRPSRFCFEKPVSLWLRAGSGLGLGLVVYEAQDSSVLSLSMGVISSLITS